MPILRNALGVNLALGFGFNKPLKDAKTEGGMAPRDAGSGGGWGGIAVGGKG